MQGARVEACNKGCNDSVPSLLKHIAEDQGQGGEGGCCIRLWWKHSAYNACCYSARGSIKYCELGVILGPSTICICYGNMTLYCLSHPATGVLSVQEAMGQCWSWKQSN